MTGNRSANVEPGGPHGAGTLDWLPVEEAPMARTDKSAELAAVGGGGGEIKRARNTPAQVGRYVVLERLGAGAVGIVYAALDPELNRRVALKLLRASLDEPRYHERLRREAQSLARLSHPNVVQVHEIGLHKGRLFLAMELVDGQTVRQWLATQRRTRSEIIDVYLRASEGLVAAHGVGLIHRDFKPDNVLVGRDGRPRVADFGLARSGLFSVPTDAGMESGEHREEHLTRTGGIVGTPAYMPPEQALGDTLTPAADQFSFCVSLYEALYGQRPFPRGTVPDARGEPRPAPANSDVPQWLRAVLMRGLEVRPQDRWPSMSALTTALQRDPHKVRARRAIRIGSVFAGAGAMYAAYAIGGWTPSPCERQADEGLERTWNSSRRASARSALLETGVGYAAETWERVEPAIDAYGSAWSEAYQLACEVSPVASTIKAHAMSSPLACLEAGRRELDALVDVLEHADSSVVQNAVQAVTRLPRLERCDAIVVRAEPEADPEQQQSIEELQIGLARVRALKQAGRFEDGLTALSELEGAVKEIDSPPVEAEAGLLRASLMVDAGDYKDAEDGLEAAFFSARASRADEVARNAARLLSQTVGVHLQRHDEGMRWASHVCADAHRIDDPLALADCESLRGNASFTKGDYEAARAHHQRALEARESLQGPEHLDVARSLRNLGNAYYRLAKFDEALALYTRAVRILQDRLGPRHPGVASAWVTTGVVEFGLGRYEQAFEHLDGALRIREQVLGPEHPEVGMVLLNLANVSSRQGEYGRAQAQYERAIKISTKALGADHPDVALARFNLGNLLAQRGKFEPASRHYEAVLPVWEKSLGPEHPHLAALVNSLGNVAFEQREFELAAERYRQAFEIRRKSQGTEHPDTTTPLFNVGTVLQAQGRLSEALETFQQAYDLREKALGPDHVEMVAPLHLLADVHRLQERCERAQELERRAIKIVETSQGPQHVALVGSLIGLARCALREGDAEAAMRHASRAMDTGLRHEGTPEAVADARLVLAQAIWTDAARRAEARALAERALAELQAARSPARAAAELAEDLRSWLAAHPVGA